MKEGDKVRVRRSSWLSKHFGDAEGEVQEASPNGDRCWIHFPSLQRFAIGCEQENFEIISTDSKYKADSSQSEVDDGTNLERDTNKRRSA